MFKSVKIQTVPMIICSVLIAVLVAAATNIRSSQPTDFPVTAEIKDNTSSNVPIIMYHAVSDVSFIQGDYVISSSEFENDLKYLSDNGYTTIFVSELVDYVKGDGELSKKPVVLTFDDGYYNNYLYVYPLLKKYNAKASISPVAYYSDLYTQSGEVSECYSHCTWDQLREMSESGYVELGNHSYNYHSYNGSQNGMGQISGEDNESYKKRITDDLTTAQDMIFENTGVTCSFIAYPFGVYNDITEEVVKQLKFTAALTCSSGINVLEKGDTEQLYKLKRLIRPHNSGLEYILSQY